MKKNTSKHKACTAKKKLLILCVKKIINTYVRTISRAYEAQVAQRLHRAKTPGGLGRGDSPHD